MKGCRRTSSGKPLASDCNACRNLKNAETGECIEKCPEGWEESDDKTCISKFWVKDGGGGHSADARLGRCRPGVFATLFKTELRYFVPRLRHLT